MCVRVCWVSKLSVCLLEICASTGNEIINANIKRVNKFQQQNCLCSTSMQHMSVCTYMYIQLFMWALVFVFISNCQYTFVHPPFLLLVAAQFVHSHASYWLCPHTFFVDLLLCFVIGNCHRVYSDLKQRHVLVVAVAYFHLFTHVHCVFDNSQPAFGHFLTLKWYSSMKRYRNKLAT